MNAPAKKTATKANRVSPETKQAAAQPDVSKVIQLSALPKNMDDVLKKTDVAKALVDLLGSFAAQITNAETDVLRSKRQHYEAVGRTFYTALLFIRDHENKKTRAKLETAIDEALKEAGIQTQATSSLALKLLKLGLGGEREKQARLSIYGMGMMRAAKNGKTSDEFADYLLETGGWSGNKRSWERVVVKERDKDPLDFAAEEQKAKAKAKQEAADFAILAAAVRSAKKCEISVKPDDLKWSKDKSKPEMVLVATYHPTSGKLQVHEVLDDSTVFDAAIRACKGKVTPNVTPVVVATGDNIDEAGI